MSQTGSGRTERLSSSSLVASPVNVLSVDTSEVEIATTTGSSHIHRKAPAWLTKERRLYAVCAIAFAFLVAELAIGFRNNSLALVADAFHITSDLIGYIVAIIAIRAGAGKGGKAPVGFSFGWQRAELLGGAFNGGRLKCFPSSSTRGDL